MRQFVPKCLRKRPEFRRYMPYDEYLKRVPPPLPTEPEKPWKPSGLPVPPTAR